MMGQQLVSLGCHDFLKEQKKISQSEQPLVVLYISSISLYMILEINQLIKTNNKDNVTLNQSLGNIEFGGKYAKARKFLLIVFDKL